MSLNHNSLHLIIDKYPEGTPIGDFVHKKPNANVKQWAKILSQHGTGRDAYWFARDLPADSEVMMQAIADMEQVVLQRGTGRDAYYFAVDVPNADVNELQKVVIRRGTGEDAYMFATYVRGADAGDLQNAILNLGDRATADDAMAAEMFSRFMGGNPLVDREKLDQFVLDHGNGDTLYTLAKHRLKNVDLLLKIQDKLTDLHSSGQDRACFMAVFGSDKDIRRALKSANTDSKNRNRPA